MEKMKHPYLCRILSKEKIADKTISLTLDISEIEQPVYPGQFFHVGCKGSNSYLRRPISVCDVQDKKLRMIFEIRGAGTEELSKLSEGDCADILGPLGRGFHIPTTGSRAAIVGGGIGSFPLLYLARALPFPCDVYLGFRTESQIALEADFRAIANVNLKICTDDGSYGYCGFAPSAFADAVSGGCKYDIIYTCGPRVMMDCVAKTAKDNGIPCQISLEERMGCGIGACLVCACSMKDKDGNSHMGHVCSDGPVFWAEQI